LLAKALTRDAGGLERGLLEEETPEREQDRRYWLPLKKKLEALRHGKR